MKLPLGSLGLILFSSLAIFSASAQLHLDWAAVYDDPNNDPMFEDEAGLVAIAPDSQGNLCVLGRSVDENMAFRFTLLKYAADGTLLWLRQYAGPGNSRNSPVAMALDAADNVYVTGNADYGPDGNSDIAVLTVKYDRDGQLLWAERHETPFPNRNYARAIAVDPHGNAWVVASVGVIRYDANGNQQWVAPLEALAWTIAVDPSGNAYAGGFAEGHCARDSAGEIVCQEEGFLVKIAPDGRRGWVRRFAAPDGRSVRFHAVTVDSNADPVATGSIWGGVNIGTEFVTAKYSSAGRRLWAAQHPDPTQSIVGGQQIAVDPAGNVFVSGGFATLKYSSDGRFLWEQREPAYLQDMAADRLGNAYVIGRDFYRTHEDLLAVKYGPCGDRIWSFQYNTNTTALEIGTTIALSSSGNVYLGGIRVPSPAASHLSDFLTLRLSQTDVPVPAVSIDATRSITSERKGNSRRPALFTVTREGPLSDSVSVRLSIGGTATNGLDYSFIPDSITIPSGQRSISIAIEAVDDALTEGTETVLLELLPAPSYQLCGNSTATASILDKDR